MAEPARDLLNSDFFGNMFENGMTDMFVGIAGNKQQYVMVFGQTVAQFDGDPLGTGESIGEDRLHDPQS
ncbi:MAG: hypothetical protein WA138_03900 [Parvibaculum sp.]